MNTNKKWCVAKNPNLFCCVATFGGYHVWETGTARLMFGGTTAAKAWENCKAHMVKNHGPKIRQYR